MTNHATIIIVLVQDSVAETAVVAVVFHVEFQELLVARAQKITNKFRIQ